MPLRARQDVAPWPPAMIVWGPGFKTARHRHHCVQLLMALRGALLVRSAREKGWRKCGAVWVRPDATHEVDARGSTLLIGFISAESDMGAALSARIDGAIACVPARQVARWRAMLGPAPSDATHRTLADRIRPAGAWRRDPRRRPTRAEPPSAAMGGARRSVSEDAGRHRVLVAVAFHACVHRIGRRSRATLHPLAPAPAGGLRLEQWRQRHERGPSRRLLGRRSPHAYVSSHARRDTVGPCVVEKGEPGICARVR